MRYHTIPNRTFPGAFTKSSVPTSVPPSKSNADATLAILWFTNASRTDLSLKSHRTKYRVSKNAGAPLRSPSGVISSTKLSSAPGSTPSRPQYAS